MFFFCLFVCQKGCYIIMISVFLSGSISNSDLKTSFHDKLFPPNQPHPTPHTQKKEHKKANPNVLKQSVRTSVLTVQ